jgi:hypothetical protein
MDQSEMNRALAKALTYHRIGKQAEAEAWARILIKHLQDAKILPNIAACPQCGEETRGCLEGVCAPCRQENQHRLLSHTAAQERNKLTDRQK